MAYPAGNTDEESDCWSIISGYSSDSYSRRVSYNYPIEATMKPQSWDEDEVDDDISRFSDYSIDSHLWWTAKREDDCLAVASLRNNFNTEHDITNISERLQSSSLMFVDPVAVDQSDGHQCEASQG